MRIASYTTHLAIRGRQQWERCGFAVPGNVARVALIDDLVMLAPLPPPAPPDLGDGPFIGGFAGPIFDRHCRFFHPRPDDGGIDYLVWGKQTGLSVVKDTTHDYEFNGPGTETSDFVPDDRLPERPVALGCDSADYLYVADAGAQPAVWLIDIWQHEIARRVDLAAPPRDVAVADGVARIVFANPDGSDPGWLSVSPCDQPQVHPWPAGLPAADRIAVADGSTAIFLLTGAGTAAATLVSLDDTSISLAVPFATDLLVTAPDADNTRTFTIARRPGEAFVQWQLQRRHFSPLPSLQARGYDGRGIAWAPDGRVAYWTARGLRHASPARTRYETEGTVLCFALDSDRDGNEWGRLLLDACVPDGTAITVRCVTADDRDFPDLVARVAPAGETLTTIAEPDATPLISDTAWRLSLQQPAQALYGDSSPPPMTPADDDPFITYDAPVIAPAGRFLWLAITLRGNGARTPKLRAVRVEAASHGLLRQLPRTLWRDPRARDFLGHYLASPAALLTEWGSATALRHRMLDPRIAPAESLDWLAGFIGLAMDPCWREAARRTMIREASALFRIRGTVRGLGRMLEILTGGRVLIVETFRLRGGGVIGHPEATEARAVLGTGFRVGGAIGTTEATPLPGAHEAPADTAHRFTVLLLARLTEEQLTCARRLVEVHKPAHTAFDLCLLQAGARVGVGLHVGLASAVGEGSGFGRLTLGDSVLGRGYVLGRPELDRPARPESGWRPAPDGGGA
jgi:phage tail-like protein